MAGYTKNCFKNCQNSKFCLPHLLTRSLTHSLPDHGHKPRGQTRQLTATILCHNNQLTSGMCLLKFRRMCALCILSFLVSQSNCSSVFFMQRNHIDALIFLINTFFEQHNRHHKIFKTLKTMLLYGGTRYLYLIGHKIMFCILCPLSIY